MLSLLKKTFGKTNEKQLKKYWAMVKKINALEPEIEKLSDDELKNKTNEFKELLSSGKTVADIRLEAFAVVREASKRILGMRHYDVQLIGGLVLSEGNIGEMATGEGKTLVASLPSYLMALEGKGVHVITVNDYLATRDRNQIGKIHEFLGLTVGLNVPMMEAEDKKAAYQADITYGIGTEFGFDYLRDNMVQDVTQRVQRPYHFAIIDEVDSVLIDEAKTPLIIAGKMPSSSSLHNIGATLAKRFVKDVDYTFDEETKATALLDEGIDKVEKAFGVDNLYDLEHQTLYHYMIQAVRAHVMFERDVDYIVKDGKIMLVDMFTGRIMEGRTMSDGLHQAIEAKEGLEITDENKTQASITIQNYFRMYPRFCGMTGTAKTEEGEFRQVYGMEVIPIPTNKQVIREDMEDKIFVTKDEKYKAVTLEVKKRFEKGQPVLVGTTSILQSETVAKYLDGEKLPYELLNAKTVEQEVELISQAGQKDRITIATNMAGRGTDIILGEGVKELGGLHVIGTERHESRRVDNQLKGRAGRQGDPGSSQFFISLEDDMFRRFAHEELEKLKSSVKADETGLIQNQKAYEFVDRTQRIVEGAHFSMREYNLKLDDVINEQRNVIYTLRDRILEQEQTKQVDSFFSLLQHAADYLLDKYCPAEEIPENWPMNKLKQELDSILPKNELSFPEEGFSRKDIEEQISAEVEAYKEKLLTLGDNEKFEHALKAIMLLGVDRNWIKHQEAMIRLKEGIGMRQYQQEDPMRIYAREGLELFENMYKLMSLEICVQLAKLLPRFISQES